MSNDDWELPTDCDFSDVEDISFPAPCSPKFKNAGFVGLVINVPEKVRLGDDFSVNVFGRYRHRLSDELSLGASFMNSIVFMAVDKETQEVYSGQIEEDENEIPDDDEGDEEEPDPEEDVRVGGYVNPDLVEVVGLPARPARYTVYATVGTYKSNVMDLEVVRAE